MIASVISFFKILILSKFVYQKAKIEEETCFILGNGPSLSGALDSFLENFQSSSVLCVNGFSSSKYFEKVKPKYFVLSAPEIWSNKATDGENVKTRSDMVNNLIAKTKWDLRLFLPTSSKKNKSFIQSFKKNPNIKISYFNTTPVEGLQSINFFLFSIGLGMPRPHNVVIPSLMVAINSKVTTVNLFGVDHSWIPLLYVDENNNALLKQEHFYDKKTAKVAPMTKMGQRKRMLHEILEKFYFAFRSYVEIRTYANKKNVVIQNCTPGSFIDAFERKSPEAIWQLDQADIEIG